MTQRVTQQLVGLGRVCSRPDLHSPMRWLFALLITVSFVTSTVSPAGAQPTASPLDSVAAPAAAVSARHSSRDVALEVVFSADGALLSWRCTVSPHPSLCAPTAAVAAWAGAPTWRRSGQPDVFRLPVAFWLPADYDRDAPGAPPLPSATPRDALSRWRVERFGSGADQEPDLFHVVEQQPVLLGGLAGLQARVQPPASARADGVEGRVFVQLVTDERGRVLDSDAAPLVCVRTPDPRLCADALAVVRASRFIPGRDRGVPQRVRYALPVTYRLSDGDARPPRARGAE